jgi:hypothetical protein
MNEQQAQLELKGEQLAINYEEPRGRYTGERFAQRPEAKIATRWLAAGHSFQRIADWLHVDRRTIQAHYYRNIKEVDQQKKIMAQEIFPVAMMSLHKVEELIEGNKDLQKQSITTGVLYDKWMQLAGVPTMRVEVNHKIDIGAELEKLNEQAREAMKQARARVVEPLPIENGS